MPYIAVKAVIVQDCITTKSQKACVFNEPVTSKRMG